MDGTSGIHVCLGSCLGSRMGSRVNGLGDGRRSGPLEFTRLHIVTSVKAHLER